MPQQAREGANSLGVLSGAYRLFVGVADGFTKRRILAALAVVATGAVMAAVTPVALKLTVDALSRDSEAPVKAGSWFALGSVVLVAWYVIGQYLTRLTVELRQYAYGQAEQRLNRRVAVRVFDHLVRLPLSFHLDRKTGAIGETIEQGIHGYQLLLTHTTFSIVPVVIEFIAVVAVLSQLGQGAYVPIITVAAVAYVIAFRHGAVVLNSLSGELSRSHIDAHAVLTDSLLNYETIKYFDAEAAVSKRYDAARARMEAAWRLFYVKRLSNGAVIASIFVLSLGCSLYLAAKDVSSGAMTVGDFVLVNAYVIRIVQPLELLGFAVRDAAQGVAFLRSLLELLQQPRESGDEVTSDAPVARSRLRFERVTFGYGNGRAVLSDVSFDVPAGSTVALVGASGSGKTSIIRLLFRLYEPAEGRILLDEQPIARLPLSLLRRSIAVVPQDTVLFHDTIANNIGFGRCDATRDDIERAARIANLHDLIRSLPDGYDTVVGERGLKLSGGERQRIAIARAALKQPQIYVFDEATSSLDTKTERGILHNLHDISAACTRLIIAHRLSTIVNADEIIVLDQGMIAERGRHAELLNRNGLYAALWRAQQQSHVSMATPMRA